MRLAVVTSHPIQYHAPLFRALAKQLHLEVFFAHCPTPADQANAGFGVGFQWDSDLFSGYAHSLLRNVSRTPSLETFGGCDTPEIGARLRDGLFDAVLVQGWHFKALLQATFAAKSQGLPVLVRGDSHLETPRSALKRAAKACAYPAFLRVFDAALYVGDRSKAYYRHYHYPKNRLFFSPHSIDSDWFAVRATAEARGQLRASLGLAPDTPVALFAGKLLPFKRPLDLVAAASHLRRNGRDIAILVAGAGPLETEMEAAAREAGIVLHMLGFRNQTEMPAAYAAADVLVLPSDGRETWGLVANEALACGRPILLSDAVGSAPDLVADGMAGRMFRMGEVNALASALAAVIMSPPTLQAIAAKSSAYSIAAAASGIRAALAATCATARHPLLG